MDMDMDTVRFYGYGYEKVAEIHIHIHWGALPITDRKKLSVSILEAVRSVLV
jgi:hypothetical protein